MNQFSMKKTFLVLVIIIVTPIIIYFVFKFQKEGSAPEQQNVVTQLPQTAIEKQPAEKNPSKDKPQEQSAEKDIQDSNEIVGTITQVDVFDDDNGDLLLTVDADIPDQSKLKDNQNIDEQGDAEVPTVTKQFLVLVEKNTPIVGGTLDELSEEDIIDIVSVENFYETNKLTAINIEEL